MVALGITAGAMLLLLSVNRNALQRSLRAQEQMRLEHACESKLDEILSGAETSRNGALAISGYTWSLQEDAADLDGLTDLKRVTLLVNSPSGTTATKTVFHFGSLPAPGLGAAK